ncbi:colicin E3/pyocin S6 family cytotoxin [Pseudomonas chlororaphis]|uniref:colicin E3/pyocin S6 family cytotoxin n=1 Tax=Pseudomonas chlororaphis TaxID=587753 RepID=UPI002407B1CB|nr:colicin E3/pyocin S6 family cytotoxin [Pseudomonas chlororaphis]
MSGYVPNAPKGYRNRGVEPVDIGEQRWAEYKDLPVKPEAKPALKGCVFAKSCALPNGVINHSNPGGFVPVESLKQYGTFAVLGTGSAIAAAGTPLQWIGGSGSASALVARLGGSLALAGSTVVGFAALLLPDDTSADSAFYTSEQYAQLSQGNTRVRINVKHLPDGSVSVYGFYTGTKAEWQQVPVIEAKVRGDQLVADIGNGLEVIWTPAADPKAVLGIPALEGVSLKPGVWVYPPTEQADKILVNPEHPPDYRDAIIWFPDKPQIAPIYLSISAKGGGDLKYHKPPKELAAFPDAKPAKDKKPVQGGGGMRRRWKDRKGRIYEWDSQHGRVEIFNSQGTIHFGEFDPETGEQTKPAKAGRTTPK